VYAAVRSSLCHHCWSFRCYYSRRNITARVVYCLTMIARAAVIRTVCVLSALGFAADAAPITPHLPPWSDRAQQQPDPRAVPSVRYTPMELADLRYDITHGTTSATPPNSPDMDEPSSYHITTWRVFVILCSVCVLLCFIMYRYRCKLGFFAEMRWALPNGNTAIHSVRLTLPFEPRDVSQPDRQSSPEQNPSYPTLPFETEQNPSYAYLRRQYTRLTAHVLRQTAELRDFNRVVTRQTAELLDLRTSNTRQSQQHAIAANKSSASMRDAAAEILSLGRAYDRSKTEGERCLTALQEATERNMATNAKLSVTQARLTGYAREIDVLERRLRDVADELRVTEEEFAEYRLCDSSGSDDEDNTTPTIAIAEPVLQDTPVVVDFTTFTENAWIDYIAVIIANRYSLSLATATNVFSNMLPTFLDSIRQHDVYHDINGSGIHDLPMWERQYAPNQFVNLDFEGYEKIHNIFAKHCGLTWALGPIWMINRRLHNTFRQVVLLKFPQVPTPHHLLDSRGNLLPIEDRKRNDLLLGVSGVIIQAKLAGDRRVAARKLRRQQLKEFEAARDLAAAVTDIDDVRGPRTALENADRVRVRGPRTASGVLLAIICLFTCIAPAHATNGGALASANAATMATAAVAAAMVAVTVSVAAVYSTTAQAAAAQQQMHDGLEANRLRGADRTAANIGRNRLIRRGRAPRGWRVPSPFRPLNQAATAAHGAALDAATTANDAALAATTAALTALAAVEPLLVADLATTTAALTALATVRGRRRRADGDTNTRRGARRRVARIPYNAGHFNAAALMF